MTQKIDRRKFERFLFSDDVKVIARLTPADTTKKAIDAEIKNLSKKGVGLRITDEQDDVLQEGEQLIITKIQGADSLCFLINMKIEAKWVMKTNPKEGIRSGCEFLDISEKIKDEIETFINAEIDQKLFHTDD